MKAKEKIFLIMVIFSPLISCHTKTKNIYDGFDADGLSKIWSSEKFLPGAFSIQSKIVKSGAGAAQITLKEGYQIEDEVGSDVERAELLEEPSLKSVEDKRYVYSFSIFLPEDFPIVSTRLVIAQWKQKCEQDLCHDDSPVIAIRYQSGKLFITLQIDSTKKVLYKSSDEVRNRWLSFKFQIRFSKQSDGMINGLLNDHQIIDYKGITCYPEKFGYPDKSKFYFKIGLYRDNMREPMNIYIDEYTKQQLD